MGSFLTVELYNGMTALINKSDWELVRPHTWYVLEVGRKRKVRYAYTQVKQKRIYMHRLIMQPGKGLEVDHLDGDGLNNTRMNLRCCTHAQNLRRCRPTVPAASGYRGVYKHGNQWRARVSINGKRITFGRSNSKEEAARIYDREMKKIFGSFAMVNFP